MDDIKTTQQAFSKIGWIYTIFSAVITFIQLIVFKVFVDPNNLSLEMYMLLNTGMMYVLGMIIIPVGFHKVQIPICVPEKKSMTLKAFFKAMIMSYSLLFVTNLIGTIWIGIIEIIKGSPIINPVEELALNMDIRYLIVFTVIGAPIFEELFFRKFIVDRTLQYGECVSIAICGLMFGLFHGNLSQFPYAFALGSFFAYIYVRTGKIGYTMIMHAIINLVGSVVGSLVIKNIDLSVYDNNLYSSTIEDIFSLLTPDNLKGMLLVLTYELVILSFVVIGIILWILEFKKFFFKPTENAIPKGRCFETSILNPGMLVYIAFWFIMIIIASI